MSAAYAALARRFKVLADPHRLHILDLIREHGERTCSQLVEPLGITQPSVSHHLGILAQNRFLTSERQGVWVYYSLVPGALDDVPALAPGGAR